MVFEEFVRLRFGSVLNLSQDADNDVLTGIRFDFDRALAGIQNEPAARSDVEISADVLFEIRRGCLGQNQYSRERCEERMMFHSLIANTLPHAEGQDCFSLSGAMHRSDYVSTRAHFWHMLC